MDIDVDSRVLGFYKDGCVTKTTEALIAFSLSNKINFDRIKRCCINHLSCNITLKTKLEMTEVDEIFL